MKVIIVRPPDPGPALLQGLNELYSRLEDSGCTVKFVDMSDVPINTDVLSATIDEIENSGELIVQVVSQKRVREYFQGSTKKGEEHEEGTPRLPSGSK